MGDNTQGLDVAGAINALARAVERLTDAIEKQDEPARQPDEDQPGTIRLMDGSRIEIK